MLSPDTGNAPCVILVDAFDNEIGIQEKLRAHQDGGQLHRAFSIFVVDERDRLLLQRRAKSKYHCPGLWANSCCSHPQPGRSLPACATQRLQEELGFSTPLQKIGAVRYRLPLGGGLTEWEFDHLFLGSYSGPVTPNPCEVEAYRWVRLAELAQQLRQRAQAYTPWLSQIFPLLLAHLRMQGDAAA